MNDHVRELIQQWDDGCGLHRADFEDIARAALEENESLRAIVAKLPQTADGVPVVPGMNCATLDGVNGDIVRDDVGVLAIICDGAEGECRLTLRDLDGAEWDADVEDCYSTREAAQAAAEKETP